MTHADITKPTETSAGARLATSPAPPPIKNISAASKSGRQPWEKHVTSIGISGEGLKHQEDSPFLRISSCSIPENCRPLPPTACEPEQSIFLDSVASAKWRTSPAPWPLHISSKGLSALQAMSRPFHFMAVAVRRMVKCTQGGPPGPRWHMCVMHMMIGQCKRKHEFHTGQFFFDRSCSSSRSCA